MSGTVRDASGAVLPGVTVTVTQVDTSVTRTTVTDAAGAYVLPNLPTGPYKFEAMLQGFRTYSQTGIVLQVGATPAINVTLAVGRSAWRICSTEPRTTTRRATPTCRCRFLMRCRSSASRPAAFPPKTGCTRAPASTP